MNGKATLLVVAGFSLIFLVVGKNLGNISSRAVDNSVEYYNQTVAHELAISAANLAANKIFFDNDWNKGFQNLDLKNGEMNATVQTVDAAKNIIKIVATGDYQGTSDTVEVTLSPSRFSKFAYYSENEGDEPIYWMSKDTVWGPLHTQDNLRVSGSPVFYGKVTINKQIIKETTSSAPKFYGGFEDGISLSLPEDGVDKVESAAETAGKVFDLEDSKNLTYEDFYLTFKEDSITYTITGEQKIGNKWQDFDSSTTVLASSLTSNGVIYVNGTDIRLQGVVEGMYTVATNESVYLDDDIVYKSDPETNPNSTDLLGIVANDNVWITKNSANNEDIKIQASIYVQEGGFGAEDYKGRPESGSIYLLGGISQQERYAVGTFSGSTIKSGFAKNYNYDDRLAIMYPPYYPGTGVFEIVSWKE